MTDMVSLITGIIGQPVNDAEEFLIYFVASVMALVVFWFILYLIKQVGDL